MKRRGYNRCTWGPHTDGALGPGGDRSTDTRGLVVTMVTSRLYTTHSRHTQLTMDRSYLNNSPHLWGESGTRADVR